MLSSLRGLRRSARKTAIPNYELLLGHVFRVVEGLGHDMIAGMDVTEPYEMLVDAKGGKTKFKLRISDGALTYKHLYPNRLASPEREVGGRKEGWGRRSMAEAYEREVREYEEAIRSGLETGFAKLGRPEAEAISTTMSKALGGIMRVMLETREEMREGFREMREGFKETREGLREVREGLSELRESIRQTREDMLRGFEETRRELLEGFKETREIIDRQFAKTMAVTEQTSKNVDRLVAVTEQTSKNVDRLVAMAREVLPRISRMEAHIGALAMRGGMDFEASLRGELESALGEDFIVRRTRVVDEHGRTVAEIDALVRGKGVLVAISVKTVLREEHVERFLRAVDEYERRTGEKIDLKVLYIYRSEPEAELRAREKGIRIAVDKWDIVEMIREIAVGKFSTP